MLPVVYRILSQQNGDLSIHKMRTNLNLNNIKFAFCILSNNLLTAFNIYTSVNWLCVLWRWPVTHYQRQAYKIYGEQQNLVLSTKYFPHSTVAYIVMVYPARSR